MRLVKNNAEEENKEERDDGLEDDLDGIETGEQNGSSRFTTSTDGDSKFVVQDWSAEQQDES